MRFSDNQVQVSILLAARNEQDNIERCLHSLNDLDFPMQNIEICIGDDDSTDDTAEIIQEFIRDKPRFKYYRISETLPGLKGKTNVLAQLAHHAEGQYFFFCDADIAVPSTWIKAMLSQFRKDTGVVIGLTRMKKSHLFADLLSLEWLFTLTIMRFFALFNIPVTGLGNNMVMTRAAYEKVGGYEKIGFSIVEDFAIFKAVIKMNFGFVQTYTAQVMAFSEPVLSLSELIVQRKRWMFGIMQAPIILRGLLIMSAFIVPIMGLISVWDPQRGIGMAISLYCFLTAVALTAIIMLKQKDLWKTVFLFAFYLLGSCALMLVIYLLPGKKIWKDRAY
jgi:cellulose synthase/poly-beta-1,6-N-acetylglucosamine synthase-like glycosyltransferase